MRACPVKPSAWYLARTRPTQPATPFGPHFIRARQVVACPSLNSHTLVSICPLPTQPQLPEAHDEGRAGVRPRLQRHTHAAHRVQRGGGVPGGGSGRGRGIRGRSSRRASRRGGSRSSGQGSRRRTRERSWGWGWWRGRRWGGRGRRRRGRGRSWAAGGGTRCGGELGCVYPCCLLCGGCSMVPPTWPGLARGAVRCLLRHALCHLAFGTPCSW